MSPEKLKSGHSFRIDRLPGIVGTSSKRKGPLSDPRYVNQIAKARMTAPPQRQARPASMKRREWPGSLEATDSCDAACVRRFMRACCDRAGHDLARGRMA